MGAINLKEGFTSLKHRIEKNPVKYIGGALAAVLLSGCVTIIAKDLVNSNPVAAAPQPTPRVTFVNTPIPTGVPTLEPTIIRPTQLPPTREAIKVPTSAAPIGGENASDPSKVSFLPELKPIVKSVGSANKGVNEGYGVETSLGKVFNITDTNTGNKEPFVLRLENNKVYFVLALGKNIDESSRFFDITDLKSGVTSIDVSALMTYKDFMAKESPAKEIVKKDYQKLIKEQMSKLGISLTMSYRGFQVYFGDEKISYTYPAPEFNMPPNGAMIYYADLPNPDLVNLVVSFNPEVERWVPNQVTLNTTPIDFPFNFTKYHFADDSNFFVVSMRDGKSFYAKDVPNSFTYGIILPLLTQKQYYSLDFSRFQDTVPALYARLNKK